MTAVVASQSGCPGRYPDALELLVDTMNLRLPLLLVPPSASGYNRVVNGNGEKQPIDSKRDYS